MTRSALLLLAFLLTCLPAAAGVDYDTTTAADYHQATTPEFTTADLPVTVALWFKTSSGGAVQWLYTVSDTAAANDYYGIAFVGTVANDPLRWQAQRGATADFADTAALGATPLGTWNSVVAVEASITDRRVYLNGVRGTDNATSISPIGLDVTTLGALERNAGPESGTNGTIAWVAVWKGYAFTDADAAAWDAEIHPCRIRPDKLFSFRPLLGLGPVGSRVRDLMGNLDLGDVVGDTPTQGDSPPVCPLPSPRYSSLIGTERRPLLIHRCREEDYDARAA